MNKPQRNRREDNLYHPEPLGDEALVQSPICTKLTPKFYEAICNHFKGTSNSRAAWIRNLIEKAALEEGLISKYDSNDLEEVINTFDSASKDYEAIKSKIINEWGKHGRMKQTEIVALAIDKFIDEISK